MGSNPFIGTSKNVIVLGEFVRTVDSAIVQSPAPKRTKQLFICQVFVK